MSFTATTSDLPPAGYLDSESRASSYLLLNALLLPVSIAAVGLRFYSRLSSAPTRVCTKSLWWDDWLALAALPGFAAYHILSCVSAHCGLGKHIWNIPEPLIRSISRLVFAKYIMWVASMLMAKFSVLLFYRRVFRSRSTPKWFEASLWITAILNVAWAISTILADFFACKPVAKSWDSLLPGECTSSRLALTDAIATSVLDLIIFIVPLPLVWRLTMSWNRKIGLSVLFSSAYCIIVVSGGCLIVSILKGYKIELDFTYNVVPIFFWYSLQVPFMMACVCLPAMSHLARRLHTSCKRWFCASGNGPKTQSDSSNSDSWLSTIMTTEDEEATMEVGEHGGPLSIPKDRGQDIDCAQA